ncbi:MAG: helix-turn-helix transcriptional regulator [Bacteroidaceae bacterium]|nr:helix-turn-helix transcriptional regulator [Bacteroidaceae bacterium]
MFAYSLFSFLPFMVALFWTAVIVLENIHGWRKGFMPNLLLSSSACSVFLFGEAFYRLVPDGMTSNIWLFTNVCKLTIYPVFYLFIKKITTSRNADIYDLLLFLPFMAGVVCILAFRMTGSVHTGLLVWIDPMYLVVLLYVSVKSSICIVRYNRQIRNFYSDITSKTFGKMLWVLFLLLFSSLLTVCVNFIGKNYFYGSLLWVIPSLLISAIIFMFFYEGLRIEFSAEDAASDQLDVNQILKYWKRPSFFLLKDTEEGTEEDTLSMDYSELLMGLDNLMKEKRIYRNPNLKITDVADALASNRTYVSNAINHGLQMSFLEYISRLRVEEAKSKLAVLPENKPIKLVAEEVGYRNDATFYRHFRKITGMTPAEWMNSNKSTNQ